MIASHIFMIVNTAAIEAFIVFTRILHNYGKDKYLRRLFLSYLGMTLIKPLIATRQTERLPKFMISSTLKNAKGHVEIHDETEPSSKHSRCIVCPKTLGQK